MVVGATSGIGLVITKVVAVANILPRGRADLVRSGVRGMQVVARRNLVQRCDVNNRPSMGSLLSAVCAEFQGVNIHGNCAGDTILRELC